MAETKTKPRGKRTAKTTAFFVRDLEGPILDELSKKLLRQVFGFNTVVTATPQKGVDRVPVRFTKAGQGSARLGRIRLPGSEDETPASVLKGSAGRRGGISSHRLLRMRTKS